jgi:phosphoribosylanthranilate isomerase
MWIKICGVCDTQSAHSAVDAGADAIGLNFVSRSRRRVSVEQAHSIADSVRGQIDLVGVVEDMSLKQAAALRNQLGLNRIQLHLGNRETIGLEIPPWAYLALGLAAPADVQVLDDVFGDPILVDASVAGKSGGTGSVFDWNWVVPIARRRRVVLAGGLTPNNVADAIALVRPWGVDVASGVEFPGLPGSKDPGLVARFVRSARDANTPTCPSL